MRLGEFVARLGGELAGDAEVLIHQVGSLEAATAGQISFLANPKLLSQAATCQAGALIVAKRHAERLPGSAPRHRILVDDAQLYFARVAQLLNPRRRPQAGVHPSAYVACHVPASVSIAPGAWVGEGVTLGENVVVGPNCHVGEGVSLGADTELCAGASIYHACQIGARCLIHAGAVIGADGFGFGRERDGSWVKIPQIGRVVIGDDVEIGANTTIDRGAIEDTVIGRGVIIDNLVHIGHNCHIGDYSALAGCTGIAGSTRIGKRCMFGGAAMISGHLNICDDVIVSVATLIMKDIHKPGVYTSSVPSMEHPAWMKNFAHLRHLDHSSDRIRALERRLAELEGKLENKS